MAQMTGRTARDASVRRKGQVAVAAGVAVPWRAWNTFTWSLAAAFVAFLAFLVASLALHLRGGADAAQADALLRLLYWGSYPLVFLALGALGWHLVQKERGAYAGR